MDTVFNIRDRVFDYNYGWGVVYKKNTGEVEYSIEVEYSEDFKESYTYDGRLTPRSDTASLSFTPYDKNRNGFSQDRKDIILNSSFDLKNSTIEEDTILSIFKEGDRVYDIRYGWGTVKSVVSDVSSYVSVRYPINGGKHKEVFYSYKNALLKLSFKKYEENRFNFSQNRLDIIQDSSESVKQESQNKTEKGNLTGQKFNSKKLPLDIVINKQFPNAITAIAMATEYGHQKYILTDKFYTNFLNVEGGSQTYADSLCRHAQHGFEVDDETNLPHLFHKAWNALAELELKIEEDKIDMKCMSEKYMEFLNDKFNK